MNQKNLDYFKKLLQQWLEGLKRQADHTVSSFMQSDERAADPVDQAAREFERNFTLRIHNRQDILIRKINQSLRDIDQGEYGICETCGNSIGLKRLKVRPVARHCIKCKTQAEGKERMLGL